MKRNKKLAKKKHKNKKHINKKVTAAKVNSNKDSNEKSTGTKTTSNGDSNEKITGTKTTSNEDSNEKFTGTKTTSNEDSNEKSTDAKDISNEKATPNEYNGDKDNAIRYEALSPKADIENGDAYANALYWAAKEKDVKNVALAGPYGSGKSSIIKCFLKKYDKIKALNISLAAFDLEVENGRINDDAGNKKENIKDNDDRQNNKILEKDIELGILKQLIYRVDTRKIPQSRFRKIQKKYYSEYFAITFIISFVILCGIAFFFPNSFKQLQKVIEYAGGNNNIDKDSAYVIAISFGLIGVGTVAYILQWIMSKIKIKEINLWGKLIAEEGRDESSIFDKTIDEILYFFEVTDYEVVFIEDLDRFEDTKIFVKLRELNNLLNNYELIKRNITFVYAVGDDLFKPEERTKFFDFIIPVIPFVNSTNSMEILLDKYEYLIQNIDSSEVSTTKRTKEFIIEIAIFIEDMRTLINICNEFIFYKSVLHMVKLDEKKLFSMMMFKTLYPKDFADLEQEKGIVKRCIENKKLTEKEYDENDKLDSIKTELNTKKALKYLIENRYIDETYADYINYFYPNSITQKEKNFIMGVRLRDWKDDNRYEYKIENKKLVCDKLLLEEFERKEILNFDIVDYLITEEKESERCKRLFKGLEKNGELCKFTDKFIERKNEEIYKTIIPTYINVACQCYNNVATNDINSFWNIIVNSGLGEDFIFRCLSLIFKYTDLNNIINQNKNSIYDRYYQDIDNDDEYEEQINYDKPNGILCFLLCHSDKIIEKLSIVPKDVLKYIIATLIEDAEERESKFDYDINEVFIEALDDTKKNI